MIFCCCNTGGYDFERLKFDRVIDLQILVTENCSSGVFLLKNLYLLFRLQLQSVENLRSRISPACLCVK